MSIVGHVRGHVQQVPAWGWFGALLLGGLGLLVWHQWATREQAHEQAAWLDPEQPLDQVDAAPQQVPQMRAKRRCYPGSLMEWPHSRVGDC